MPELVKAEHKVFGEVEVPETYLDMWPKDYKPAKETKATAKPDDAEPDKG